MILMLGIHATCSSNDKYFENIICDYLHQSGIADFLVAKNNQTELDQQALKNTNSMTQKGDTPEARGLATLCR